MRVDVLLDDYIPNLDAAAQVGVVPILFEHQWNAGISRHRSVRDFAEFAEVIEMVEADQIKPDSPHHARKPEPSHPQAVGSDGAVIEVDLNTGGRKGSKPSQLSLVPPRMLQVLGEVYGNGAKKYSRDNWRLGHRWSLSFDALMRHALAFWEGEDLDDIGKGGDGLPHMMHAAFHCFTLATFADEGLGTDDRPYSIGPGAMTNTSQDDT